MGKSRKDYEKYLNSISPDRDDERWIIGGKNRYCGRENYGTMIKRYDPIGFNVGYREDEEGEEWEEVDSCWGYYMETDELIEEIMKEHNLKE